MDASVGFYPNGDSKYYQGNFSYRFSNWRLTWSDHYWQPLQLGVFIINSWDTKNYFLKSPGKYPYEDYYDQTALRYGLEFGTTLGFPDIHFAIAYRLRVLDSGIIALYNNRNRDLQYYISSGISFQYIF